VQFTHNEPTCHFTGVTFGPSKAVFIQVEVDVSTITQVSFSDSSIYSVPRDIFMRFPNLKVFRAYDQRIQEIKPHTFWEGRKLEKIGLRNNLLTFLHKYTFKGWYF
jgi:hypothetical protein